MAGGNVRLERRRVRLEMTAADLRIVLMVHFYRQAPRVELWFCRTPLYCHSLHFVKGFNSTKHDIIADLSVPATAERKNIPFSSACETVFFLLFFFGLKQTSPGLFIACRQISETTKWEAKISGVLWVFRFDTASPTCLHRCDRKK